MCQLLNRGNLVTGAKVFTNGSGRDNWVSKMGVGLVKEQRAQGEGGRGDFLGVLGGCAILLFKPDLISDKGFPYVTSIFRHGFY